MKNTYYWLDMPVMEQHFTTIRLWRNKEPYWIEFRGDGYHQWTDLDICTKSHCQRLHDSLEGWHACVLHAGDKLAILPSHPEYNLIEKLYLNGGFDSGQYC